MKREKELYKRLGITKRRRVAACIAEGIYVLIFLIAAVWKKDMPAERLISMGIVIMAAALNYMANIKNHNGESELTEILKFYPIDGNNIYKMIRGMIGKFTLIHWCISLIMICVLGKTEKIFYVTAVILLTGIFTNLGYWIGYGRAMKEDRGRESSLGTSLGVCLIFTYPLLLLGIAAITHI